jgi:hypothetical protein
MITNNGEVLCKNCGKPMKKSGPFLHEKKEGESAFRGKSEVYCCCMNSDCGFFYKNIRSFE